MSLCHLSPDNTTVTDNGRVTQHTSGSETRRQMSQLALDRSQEMDKSLLDIKRAANSRERDNPDSADPLT